MMTARKRVAPAAESDRHETSGDKIPADLILVEQSGAKHELPQPSVSKGIREAEKAVRRGGRRLRELKVVAGKQAVARWKSDGQEWQRVA